MFDVKVYNTVEDVASYSPCYALFVCNDEDAVTDLVNVCLSHGKPVLVAPHAEPTESNAETE